MAGNIKGITIEIGGDTTDLQRSLKSVDKELKNTQSTLKDVNKLLKLDPTNTELLRQKQKALKDAISETKDRLAMLKSVNKDAVTPEQWDAVQREIIETEQNLSALETEYKNFGSVAGQVIQAAGQKMQEFGGKVEEVGRKLQPLSTAAAGVVASLVGMGYKAVQSADELATLSQRTGISTDDLQKFQYASDLVDVSLEDMTGALKKMKSNMTGHADTWAELGVAVTNADGSMRDANDVFKDTLKALSKIDNETERDQKAMDLFGKSADNLAGIIDDGGAALEEYGQQAEDLGLILSTDTIESLNATNDTIDQTKAQLAGAFGQLGATVATTLAPLITQIASGIEKVTQKLQSLSPETMETILKIAAVVAAVAPVITVVGKVISTIGTLTKTIGTVVSALGAVNPIVLIVIAAIAALVAAGVWLYKHWDEVKAFAVATWNAIKTAVVNAVNGLKTGVTNAWNAVKTAVTNTVNAIKSKVVSVWTSITSSVKAAVNALRDGVTGAWDAMKEKISGVVDNIKSKLDIFKQAFENIREKVQAVIDKIKSLFSFELPPGLTRLLNGGVSNGVVVNGINYGTTTAPTAPNVNSTANVTINVYAAEGMDVNELADRIQDRFVAMAAQRNLAYA